MPHAHKARRARVRPGPIETPMAGPAEAPVQSVSEQPDSAPNEPVEELLPREPVACQFGCGATFYVKTNRLNHEMECWKKS